MLLDIFSLYKNKLVNWFVRAVSWIAGFPANLWWRYKVFLPIIVLLLIVQAWTNRAFSNFLCAPISLKKTFYVINTLSCRFNQSVYSDSGWRIGFCTDCLKQKSYLTLIQPIGAKPYTSCWIGVHRLVVSVIEKSSWVFMP